MMVRCMKEESKGKSEEELAELFRMFDKYLSLLFETKTGHFGNHSQVKRNVVFIKDKAVWPHGCCFQEWRWLY